MSTNIWSEKICARRSVCSNLCFTSRFDETIPSIKEEKWDHHNCMNTFSWPVALDGKYLTCPLFCGFQSRVMMSCLFYSLTPVEENATASVRFCRVVSPLGFMRTINDCNCLGKYEGINNRRAITVLFAQFSRQQFPYLLSAWDQYANLAEHDEIEGICQ